MLDRRALCSCLRNPDPRTETHSEGKWWAFGLIQGRGRTLTQHNDTRCLGVGPGPLTALLAVQ